MSSSAASSSMSSPMSSPMSSSAASSSMSSSAASSSMSSSMPGAPTVIRTASADSVLAMSPATMKTPCSGTSIVMETSKPPSVTGAGLMLFISRLARLVQCSEASISAPFAPAGILQGRTLAEATVHPEPVTVNVASPASATYVGLTEMDGPSCADAALAPTQVTSAKAIAMNTNLVFVMT